MIPRPRRVTALAALLALGQLHAQSTAKPYRVFATFAGARYDDEAPSPDGRWLVRSANKQIGIYDVARKSTLKIADMPGWEMSWAPRGDAIAFVRGDDEGQGEYIWYVAIDPATGKARGMPRRVSTGQAEFPSISNDGKLIAFSVKDTGRTYNLEVMPVNGGQARVVAHVAGGFEGIFWSADDKWLFFNGPLPAAPQMPRVLKVSAAGGTPVAIGPSKVWIAGMTQDRRYLVTVPASSPVRKTDRAVVIDTDGREVGRTPLPVGEISEYSGVIGDSSLVWVEILDHKRITVRDANGSTHQLPLVGQSNLFPHWSPDGRSLAFLVQNGGTSSLAISGANGERPTVFHDTDVRSAEWAMAWSPDGRSIAYERNDLHSVWVLDVASGKSRRIFNDTANVPGMLIWRADNSGVRFTTGRAGAMWSGSVFDVALNGQSRELAQLTNISGIKLLGPNALFVRDDSIATVRSFDGRAPTRIASVDAGTKLFTVGTSPDHGTIAGVLAPEQGGRRNRLEILSPAQHTRRLQVLPFVVDQFVHFPQFSPSGTSVLLFGKNVGDSTTKLYEVPLGGGDARTIADIGSVPRDASVSVSADGRLAYTTMSAQTDYNLLLIDLPPAIRSASRQTRR